MNCAFAKVVLLACSAWILVSCRTNPYTGRSQLILLDRETELALGAQAYEEYLGRERNVTLDPRYVAPVRRVTERLAYHIEQGWDDIKPPRFNWKVTVIDKPGTANGRCDARDRIRAISQPERILS
ncbi:MAG: hypothetical protein HY716_10635 [Planctomycetes bacterium]|nr:hypothetical protein [Planctomycetota bacterium]